MVFSQVVIGLQWHLQFIQVLATGTNYRVGSGSGSTPSWTVATGLSKRKTQIIGNVLVLPQRTVYLKYTILAPSRNLSSDYIKEWSICTLCRFTRSGTFHCWICDQTNISWVALENLWISSKIWFDFPAIQRTLVQSEIWQREVEAMLKLNDLQSDHISIRSELRYLIGVNVAGNIKWNQGPARTCSKKPWFMSGPG